MSSITGEIGNKPGAAGNSMPRQGPVIIVSNPVGTLGVTGTAALIVSAPVGTAGAGIAFLSRSGSPGVVSTSMISGNGAELDLANFSNAAQYRYFSGSLGSLEAFNITVAGGTQATVKAFGAQAVALVDMTPDSSSFTGTLSGMNATVTGVVNFRKMGNLACVYVLSILGTSNANTMAMTGIPAFAQAVARLEVPCIVRDNGVERPAYVDMNGATWTFAVGTATLATTGFTVTGQKGLNLSCWMYPIG
jgi:hypothetical protein